MTTKEELQDLITLYRHGLDELIRDGGSQSAIEEARKEIYLLQVQLDYLLKGYRLEAYCTNNPDDIICRIRNDAAT